MNAAAQAAARFQGVPTSVARARAFVADALGADASGLCDVATVVVSELASNAVLHAGSDFTVQVERTGDRVRVTVADHGGGRPALQHPTPRDLHGRGLQIVDQLTAAWGVSTGGDGSTAVWFEVELGSR